MLRTRGEVLPYRDDLAAVPEQVIEQATRLAQDFGSRELSFIFKYGSMPIEEAKKSMSLFAKEVLPALKEVTTKPIEVQVAA